jgi:pullulanase/glycogen debranching enzyme
VPDIGWFGADGKAMEWELADNSLACLLEGGGSPSFLLMFHAGAEPQEFLLPPAPRGGTWYRALDTGLAPPLDFPDPGREPQLDRQERYPLSGRSMAVLLAR